MQNAEELIMLLRTYMHSGTQKCVYYLHIHFCLTFLFLSPLHTLSSFLFQWQDMEDRRQGDLWGGRPDGLLQRSTERGQTSTVQFSAAVHLSSFLTITGFCVPEQPLFLLSGAISSSGVDHVQHKAQSDIGEFTEGQFSNPDFPYSTVLSAIS